MAHPMHPLVLTDDGDTVFQGDVEAGKALVRQDYTLLEGHTEASLFFAHICDDAEGDDVAFWGRGKTQEEAWRFALGEALGPIDEEYDESKLIAALQIHKEGKA